MRRPPGVELFEFVISAKEIAIEEEVLGTEASLKAEL
jgi:hypothetical protein